MVFVVGIHLFSIALAASQPVFHSYVLCTLWLIALILFQRSLRWYGTSILLRNVVLTIVLVCASSEYLASTYMDISAIHSAAANCYPSK